VKKWVIVLSLVILVAITYKTFSNESEYYAKTVPVFRVYHHNRGFVVLYQKQNTDIHRIFVPYSWFQVQRDSNTPLRAELFYGHGIEYPYMQIFWDRNGFSHIRLFLMDTRTHRSWGNLHNPNNFNDRFDIEAPDFQF